jgi:hypothetical protein
MPVKMPPPNKEIQQVDEVLSTLKQGKTNLCCKDLTKLLVSLGYTVRDGKRGGHKVFTHQDIEEFYSDSFNCGHGTNPEIKPAYISKVRKLVEKHKDELVKYLAKKGK